MEETMEAILEVSHSFDEVVVIGAFLVSVLSLIRAIIYRNAIPLRIIKFFLVGVFVILHYVMYFYRAVLIPDARSVIMELEFVSASAYMLINGVQAYALMADERKKSNDARAIS